MADNSISNCKQPFGNPPCHHADTTFDNGAATGCTVDFHWLQCNGITHGQVYDACRNGSCHTNCSCSCGANGYARSWVDDCSDVVKSESYSCNRCGNTAMNDCTTPNWDGSCPAGTAPNGSGLCCASGGTCYGGNCSGFTRLEFEMSESSFMQFQRRLLHVSFHRRLPIIQIQLGRSMLL